MVQWLTVAAGVAALVALLAPDARFVAGAVALAAGAAVGCVWMARFARYLARTPRAAAWVLVAYLPSIPLTFGLSLWLFPVALYCAVIVARRALGLDRASRPHLPIRM